MLHSTERILTTHAGSLPRPRELCEIFARLNRRQPICEADLNASIEAATRAVIRKQLDAGVDIGNNGEQSRESFFTYVQHRMSGFGGRSERPPFTDITAYPSYLARFTASFSPDLVDLLHAPKAIGEVRYVNRMPLERECAEYVRIAGEFRPGFRESFMTAPSPGIIASAMLNDHYRSLGAYVEALVEALRFEYETIVAHGLILQIDAPDLAMERHVSYGGRPLTDFQEFVELIVAAINRALEKIPRDRVRLHVCWGNYEGPHDRDVALANILPILAKTRCEALLISMANPRHEHEYRCFAGKNFPSDMVLLAGVIDTTTNYIEHPEVVADRIERVARTLGDPTRVIAATDCGFETTVGLSTVAEEVVWAKLKALRDGAAIASKRLFG